MISARVARQSNSLAILGLLRNGTKLAARFVSYM